MEVLPDGGVSDTDREEVFDGGFQRGRPAVFLGSGCGCIVEGWDCGIGSMVEEDIIAAGARVVFTIGGTAVAVAAADVPPSACEGVVVSGVSPLA